jgi:hypothetical protein
VAALCLAPCSFGQSASPSGRRTRPPQDRPEVNQAELDAEALEEFKEELDDYVRLRRKLEAKLPPLPRQGSQAEVHEYEVTIEKLIEKARVRAREGDLFVSEVRPLIRRLCRNVFATPQRKALLSEIREESAERMLRARVNGRYPYEISFSSVPPDLLKVLPPLPDALEYRFLGAHLILIDVEARIILDVLRNVIPR